jgi:hypothetical protein
MILAKHKSLATICFLGNVTISKAYQNPTSPYEKRDLGSQFMASPWLELMGNGSVSSAGYQKAHFTHGF